MTRIVNIPKNVDVDENITILAIPKAGLADPSAPTVAELTAAVDVTYEFTSDSNMPTSSQQPVTDPRFSLRDVPQRAGTVSHTFAPTYYYGEPELKLDPLLEEDEEVYFVFRDSVHITEDFVPTTQTVDVYSTSVGHAQKNRATNGKQTKTTPLFVHRKYTDVAIKA